MVFGIAGYIGNIGPWELMILLIYVPLYFIPSIIAYTRQHENKKTILIINILAGWTGIGWVVALIWSLIDSQTCGQKTVNPTSNSPADELRKYKQLLDEGIITEPEFDAMKQKLLDEQLKG